MRAFYVYLIVLLHQLVLVSSNSSHASKAGATGAAKAGGGSGKFTFFPDNKQFILGTRTLAGGNNEVKGTAKTKAGKNAPGAKGVAVGSGGAGGAPVNTGPCCRICPHQFYPPSVLLQLASAKTNTQIHKAMIHKAGKSKPEGSIAPKVGGTNQCCNTCPVEKYPEFDAASDPVTLQNLDLPCC